MNQFICMECQKIFTSLVGLGNHISYHHGMKIYYDKHHKKIDEGICQICNEPTKFISATKGYAKSCCKDHEYINKGRNLISKIKKKYGVNSPMQVDKIKDKQRASCLFNNGVRSMLEKKEIRLAGLEKSRSKKAKKKRIETNLRKYGFENPAESKEVREKIKTYFCKNYNENSFMSTIEFREKSGKTMQKKYGVEYSMQNKDIFEKQQRSGFLSKKFGKSNILYRGNFELDFLEKYFELFKISNAPSIKYYFDCKNKIYHPDFIIESHNLIIEIKNSYLAKRDASKMEAKKEGVLKSGYKYILIIDKDYTDFNNLINI
jgi:hypothetical protein